MKRKHALMAAILAATAYAPYQAYDLRPSSTKPPPKRNTHKRGQRKQKGKR